jgi:murein L,D-transpeptidase YafK
MRFHELISITLLTAFVFGAAAESRADFKSQQLKFQRVRNAYAHKEATVKALFKEKKVAYPPEELFLRVFKTVYRDKAWTAPGEVEMWARGSGKKEFTLIKTYDICAASGAIGPKRMEGDGQVPEGFYEIANFNPTSGYHMSLRVNYPNASDKILSDKKHPGGDIYIHGNCVTIGCIPLTDEFIEELYVAAVDTRNRVAAPIRVNIFPLRMDAAGMSELKKEAGADKVLLSFWNNLRTGYLAFERAKTPPRFSVDKKGMYVFVE